MYIMTIICKYGAQWKTRLKLYRETYELKQSRGSLIQKELELREFLPALMGSEDCDNMN